MEMYGVGESLGPQLMAEIGDVRRFERKQSLVAFAGIDPAPSESGDYCSRSNKTTKRGSPYLRKTLFNIMKVHLQRAPADEPVFQFLDKKRAAGQAVLRLHDGCGKQVSAPLLRQGDGLSLHVWRDLPPVDMDSTGSAPHGVTDCYLTSQVGAFAAAFLCYTFSTTCCLQIFLLSSPLWSLTFYLQA